ncbi:sugar-transfer associated ATP-grasp domain-containing protein [Sphingobium sp. CR2-8]|uniref:sugar-transfer associated ATP-grasp domain-containing protein n=1 Tax=Sphingobium sp. CR2-8 TaxID=1306534 RepID=UPI002DBC0075|nr:sugar-transfer associated ATP-grasp domain-containing protein [Sphingobium sp. CR2-8]MEC3910001.1 sugar-transfer associated ATP-grasp domain-containing protein [Sphingobium sp. CR2-8]
MLTLRALPVRGEGDNVLLRTYHDGLMRHWTPAQRLAAHMLSILGRDGWSRAERRYLDDAVRGQGISMRDRKGVHRLLNPAAFPLGANPLKNKQLFAQAAAGLPLPGACNLDVDDLDAWLAGQDAIIAKPSYRSKGQGVERFVREGDLWRDGAHALTTVRLTTHLRRVWGQGGVIQTCLQTHGALADLSPGALPTLRIVTCMNEQDKPEICDMALRLSAGGPRPVDNFNAGNLVLAVDPHGRCGVAWRSGGKRPPSSHSRHPTTGAQIEGVVLPYIAAARSVAIRAHERFRPGFTVIGWDIGLTPQGPVLVEGNWNPGTDIVQLVNGLGVGDTRLGILYRHALDKLTGADWRQARVVQRDRR